MASSVPEPAGSDDGLIGQLERGRRQYLALVEPVRAELHRYCARMTGSVADGEDVVQETLAAAYYELSQLKELPPLRPWLFRIAHNRAIDHWRREQVRQAEPLDAAAEVADEPAREPDHVLARHQAVHAAISSFLELAPAQRACVILKDVLEHSLDDIAVELDMSVPAVKAALHRGRAALPAAAPPAAAPRPREVSAALQRYASLFNAHDWDGVRSMLADDVKLDLVSRRKLAGREVGSYFTNYDSARDWQLTPAWLDGREVLGVRRQANDARSGYIIALDWRDGRVQTIRDYRYVPYIVQDAELRFAG
jgi:RNA polymerase sigma-70 factor, ECF subfamily